MTAGWAGSIGPDASIVAAIITLRTLTFAGWALVSRNFTFVGRAISVLAYASLVLLAASSDRSFTTVFVGVAEGMTYYAVSSLGIVLLARKGAFRGRSRLFFCVLSLVAFLIVPARFFVGAGGVAILLAGWELAFGSYSYMVEVGYRAATVTVREGLFFLLVNPTVSYPDRGEWVQDPASEQRGVVRCAQGAALLLAQLLIVAGFPRAFEATPTPQDIRSVAEYGAFVGAYGGRLARIYCTQCGVACIHVGLLALVGFRAPERFLQPWRATTPADFWRRWNTYIGTWFRRYVFNPLSYALARRRILPSASRTAVAVLVTFVIAGLSHDLVWVLESRRGGTGSLAFAFQSLALIAFSTPPIARAAVGAFGRTAHVATRLCFWHTLLVTAWLVIPRSLV